jgi:cell division protein FtsN
VIGIACVLALGATFAAGVLSARKGWGSGETKATAFAGWKSWLGIAPRKSAAEAAGDRTRPERASRSVPPAPVLTFYHELTAPLAPAPPPPKARPTAPERLPGAPVTPPARPEYMGGLDGPPKPPSARSAPAEPWRSSNSLTPSEASPVAPPAVAPSQPAGVRFTIQVGAYRTRAAAEALQARLGEGGHEVYIVEAPAPEGVRYRVRVGSFATEDVARTAASKLADEQHVPIYVTAR